MTTHHRLLVLILFFFVQYVAIAQEQGHLPLKVGQAKQRGVAADLDLVQVAADNRSFVLEKSGREFVPWGFNYDHDGPGRLIEDYWDDEWPMVAEDFREMKELGATVVRIHLQFGKFMDSPDEPNRHSLRQLARLVKLAEQVGLYLDLTGLGCYHKKDVPPWYDKLKEEDRWAAQAAFWEAIAKTCAESPAIFCYDLMNEPVVGGAKRRDDWLGGAFAGKHFVQFIVLETKGRPRHEIARQWINRLVAAIRKHDQRHLVTVGLVHWSLDRPGLTSGFVPEKIADKLDFIAMHIYPEKGKVDEALETLKGFAAVGKPVVIEETFVLKCSQDEMSRFIDESKSVASGWISFYWGKTPEECRKGGTIGEAIMANWLELFPKKMELAGPPSPSNVEHKATYTNPVGDEPLHVGDPFVLQHEGRYYLFGTNAPNEGIRCLVSTDLVHWEPKGWAYRETPDSWAKSHYWAPEVKQYDDKFYMTYSANHTGFPHYGVGYATADKPLGPWVKAEENPIAATDLDIGVSGPGHSCITSSPDGTEMFIVYHTHADAQKPSGDRVVNIDRIGFDKFGKLKITGPTRSPQPMPSRCR